MKLEENEAPRKPVSSGNDISDGDAREEGRMDKDEDLKKGNDNDSPLAKPFEEQKKKITPDSLSSPDPNNGHNKGTMDEHEEPEPTAEDMPDLKVDYPDENKPAKDK